MFSGTVKIADLNDFIAPAQSCVVSLSGKTSAQPEKLSVTEGEVLLRKPAVPGGFKQTQEDKESGAVKVTLHDCLACSGCVTSAETVLLQQQSTDELLETLRGGAKTVIVSIAPQCRASLAVLYNLTPTQVIRKLSSWLKSLGVAYILDTSASRDIALLETAREFVDRYVAVRGHPGVGNGSHDDVDMDEGTSGTTARGGPLPMLASACPGWVCYAEKTHTQEFLSHLSSARSPMAVMGALVKRVLAPYLGLQPEHVYHVSIMPCYDKKLEAARDDLCLPGTSIPETDIGLTTAEVQQLLQDQGVHLPDVPEVDADKTLANIDDQGRLYGWPGGSGGYMEFVFRAAAWELFGHQLPPGRLPARTVRNMDFQEISLEHEGKVVLRFAAVYGFRNIQTLTRKMRTGRCEYDYVEVMACPSGCLNGGGQLKAAAGLSSQQQLKLLDAAYHDNQEVIEQHPSHNPVVQKVYATSVTGGIGGPAARDLFHTSYHKREKTVNSQLADW